MTAADTPPPSDLVWVEAEGGGGGEDEADGGGGGEDEDAGGGGGEDEDAGGSAGGKATDATTLSASSSISSVALR